MSRPVWVMFGFDTRSFEQFLPTPGVFLTEAEANHFVKKHSRGGIVYHAKKTVTGGFSAKEMKR